MTAQNGTSISQTCDAHGCSLPSPPSFVTEFVFCDDHAHLRERFNPEPSFNGGDV